MITRKDLWDWEYGLIPEMAMFVSTNRVEPSRVLVRFIESIGDKRGEALVVGCGRGRNGIYLGQKEWHVSGIDFVPKAIADANQNAQNTGVADRVKFTKFHLNELIWLPFANEQFDLIVDMMCMHTLSDGTRAHYGKQVGRTLMTDGVFLFFTIATESPAVQQLIASSPGPEPNSYILENGMIEKSFTIPEILEMFPGLQLGSFYSMEEKVPISGQMLDFVFYAGTLVKPISSSQEEQENV